MEQEICDKEEETIIQWMQRKEWQIIAVVLVFMVVAVGYLSFIYGMHYICVNSGGDPIEFGDEWKCSNITIRQIEVQKDTMDRIIDIQEVPDLTKSILHE